jgi:hypothetical protein
VPDACRTCGVNIDAWRAEVDRLLADRVRLREAMASALTSLATGSAKDGYAYAVLDEALNTGTRNEEGSGDAA